ncbi:hypothetical protein [Rhodosalinus sp.]|uniref:hypothetical protein n=1 Tax=Rhodosalinus sp. TaxID=2047741 RepID=UPI00397B8A4C
MEKLKAARKVLVRIVQARDDGGRFLPLILELERHITAEADLRDDLARILNEAA